MVRGCEFEYSTIESEKGDWMDDLKKQKTLEKVVKRKQIAREQLAKMK